MHYDVSKRARAYSIGSPFAQKTNAMNTLANKRIIVTGGTMGIGQAVAIRAAQEGADVAFCGLSEAGAEATIQAIEAAGGRSSAPSTCATWTRRAALRARRSPSSAAWMGW